MADRVGAVMNRDDTMTALVIRRMIQRGFDPFPVITKRTPEGLLYTDLVALDHWITGAALVLSDDAVIVGYMAAASRPGTLQ